MSNSAESGLIESVRTAAERLARLLSRRDARALDLSSCSDAVPSWWRQGLARAAIFGDGLLSLPALASDTFSRPVAFLSASEMSVIAGGEYVPVAWMDGGAAIALVHDRGTRPVVVAGLAESPLGQLGVRPPTDSDSLGAEPLADSLAGFLDQLRPQTVSRFAARGQQATIELSGEYSLLVERNGPIERRDFQSDDDIAEFVASFVVDVLDAGMQVVFCPARMRQLIAARTGAAVLVDLLPEQRAGAAIRYLLDNGSLELDLATDRDRDEQIENFVDDAARFLEKNQKRRNLIKAFGDWLAHHPLVDDLYADDDAVAAALASLESEPDPGVS
ncbi:MAG: hypothetical protein MJE77_46425 [Proteobacteria bacterium]|nr:hypothetical protein [Pseudomonadota bacterium]